MKIIREPKMLFIAVGAFAFGVSWDPASRFRNGSRWFSGWHRWRPSHPVYCETCRDYYPPDSAHAQLGKRSP